MAQHALHLAEVGAALDHAPRQTVTQRMRCSGQETPRQVE
jgi:hypothetical protein